MKKNILLIATLLLTLNSCGPSKEEIEKRESIKNDSITRAAQAELINEQVRTEQLEGFKQQLIELQSQLAGAETMLSSIQEFKLLRTAAEKAQQVEDQTRVIEDLKRQIEEINNQINKLQ